MSQTLHLMFANNVGHGMPDGKCLPCSGVSGRTAAAHSGPSLGYHRIHPRVRIVCEVRRNSDFSKQNNNKHGPSRGRNRNNDGRDIFENFEEDMLSPKNGPLVSPSHSGGRFQATSPPGSREKEIVELFRKVQARLRERASAKEEKKIEAPRGHVKEKNAVDSLLNLLKKHSASVGDKGKDLNSDQLQESNQYNGRQSTKFNSNSAPKEESPEANTGYIARPRSNFQRKSPVPRIKYQPDSDNENDTNIMSIGSADSEDEPEADLETKDELFEPEADLETKDELFFQELSEDDSHESEPNYNDESVEQKPVVSSEDLNALKLSELRTVAKSRGLKGYSKMKKSEILELLTES